MSRIDRKGKKKKESLSNSPYFYRMKIRRFLKWGEGEKKKYRVARSIDITDSGYISAIRLKGIEMNIGSHDESSSLN